MEEEEEEVANEEMAEGGQMGGSKGVGLGKGGGGGWLALLICKTANLRTLCLPALSSSFSTFSTTAFSSYGRPLLALSRFYYPFLSLSRARLISAQSLFLSLTHASLGPCKHAYQFTLSLSRSRHSLPSHLLAFPHPCGTSRKLYVPTLATLNAGLARDNPRPPPPPSTAAATPRVALSSSYPSMPPHRPPPFLFSPTVLPDSQPANQHASRLNPRST